MLSQKVSICSFTKRLATLPVKRRTYSDHSNRTRTYPWRYMWTYLCVWQVGEQLSYSAQLLYLCREVEESKRSCQSGSYTTDYVRWELRLAGEARKLLCVHTLCLREGQGALKCTLKSRRVLLLSNCNPSTKSFKYQKAFLYPYMMLSHQPSPSIEKEVNFKLWLSHHSQTSQPTEGSDFSSMTGSSQELSSSNSTTLQ